MPLSRRTLIGSSLAAATAAIRPAHAAANVLRIGISTSLDTLDPVMVTTGDEYIYANLVFNGLARMSSSPTWPRAGPSATTSSAGHSACAVA
jgi:peptide/nickel transport system substrate-binding protein